VTETILRALIESGERWDDPSEDLLFDLLSDIEAGEGSFLIVERAADVNGQTYSQALHLEDGRAPWNTARVRPNGTTRRPLPTSVRRTPS
jgi:hypothetical protein